MTVPNPGLPQGFVRLDSMAAKILRAYFEYGGMSHTDLVRTVEADPRHVSTIVVRLYKLGYVFRQNRASKYETEFIKTEWVYGLIPNKNWNYTPKASAAARSARYRANKLGKRANSIFNLGRSQINVQL